jgi:membrane protein involved in colicin uptake
MSWDSGEQRRQQQRDEQRRLEQRREQQRLEQRREQQRLEQQRLEQRREQQRLEQQRLEQQRLEQRREQQRVEDERIRAAQERDRYYERMDAANAEHRRQESVAAAAEKRKRSNQLSGFMAGGDADWGLEDPPSAAPESATTTARVEVDSKPSPVRDSDGDEGATSAGTEMRHVVLQAAGAIVLAAAAAGWARAKSRKP